MTLWWATLEEFGFDTRFEFTTTLYCTAFAAKEVLGSTEHINLSYIESKFVENFSHIFTCWKKGKDIDTVNSSLATRNIQHVPDFLNKDMNYDSLIDKLVNNEGGNSSLNVTQPDDEGDSSLSEDQPIDEEGGQSTVMEEIEHLDDDVIAEILRQRERTDFHIFPVLGDSVNPMEVFSNHPDTSNSTEGFIQEIPEFQIDDELDFSGSSSLNRQHSCSSILSY